MAAAAVKLGLSLRAYDLAMSTLFARIKRLLLALLLLPAIAAGDDDDHERARRLMARGEILPLSAILQSAAQIQPGRVIEVDLDRDDGIWVYELEVLDERGRAWELEFDARTGRLIKRERED